MFWIRVYVGGFLCWCLWQTNRRTNAPRLHKYTECVVVRFLRNLVIWWALLGFWCNTAAHFRMLVDIVFRRNTERTTKALPEGANDAMAIFHLPFHLTPTSRFRCNSKHIDIKKSRTNQRMSGIAWMHEGNGKKHNKTHIIVTEKWTKIVNSVKHLEWKKA